MENSPTPIVGAVETVPRRTWHWLKITLLALAVFIFLLAITYQIWLPRAVIGYSLFALKERNIPTQVFEKRLDSAPATGLRYEFEGLVVQIPWTDFSLRRGTSTMVLHFGTSTDMRTVALFGGQIDGYKTLISEPDASKFFGDGLSTNYDVYRAVVEVQPSEVNLLAPPRQFMPKGMLLVLKSVTVPMSLPAHRFENMHGVRGFHYESSATSTFTELFTPSDKQYTLITRGATSEEVDAILQSLQEATSVQGSE